MADGISLPLSKIKHCLGKKESNNLAFYLKSITNLLPLNTGYFFINQERFKY